MLFAVNVPVDTRIVCYSPINDSETSVFTGAFDILPFNVSRFLSTRDCRHVLILYMFEVRAVVCSTESDHCLHA
jgi:hypothetical protein